MSNDMWVPSTQKGIFGNIVLWLVAFLLLGAVIFGVGYAFNWWFAPYQGKLQARQQIQGNGDFRIQAYNQFFDLCATVTTLDQQLQQTLAQEKADKGSDLSRDKINFGAQFNSRNEAANQYNVNAQKHYTVGQFKASDLPYQIPSYQKGQVFTCAR